MQTGIPFYKSKTFWVNILAIITAIVGYVSDPSSALHLGQQGMAILGGVTFAINLILRLFFTSQPIQGTNTNT
jgi:hypothetical protein